MTACVFVTQCSCWVAVGCSLLLHSLRIGAKKLRPARQGSHRLVAFPSKKEISSFQHWAGPFDNLISYFDNILFVKKKRIKVPKNIFAGTYIVATGQEAFIFISCV